MRTHAGLGLFLLHASQIIGCWKIDQGAESVICVLCCQLSHYSCLDTAKSEKGTSFCLN